MTGSFVGFARALRDEGVEVGTGAAADFVRAAELCEDAYWAGRATLVFHRQNGAWLGIHSHLSLNRGVPQASHGNRPVKAR